jgi:hypothetical protein
MLSLVGEGEKSVSCRFKSADVLKILAFSALFGLARAVFYALKLNDSLVPEMQVFFRASILCTAFLFFLIVLTQQMLIRQPEMGIVSSPMKHFPFLSRKHFFFLFLFVYSVALLTWFPGTTYYDTLLIYFNRMSMMTQFPPLYCFWITLMGNLGRAVNYPRLTMILLSVTQILAVSAMMAQICHWIYKKTLPTWFKTTAILFSVLNPLYSMYAIAVIKDTLSSLSLVVIITILYDMAVENGEKETANWHVLAVCMVFPPAFRSNGFFIILILLTVMFFRFRNSRRQVLFLFAELLLIQAAGKLLLWRFGVTPFIQEALAIPLQQLCAVVAWNGRLTAEQAAFINNLLPLDRIRELYNPSYVDQIKWHAEFGGGFLEANLSEFFKIWFEVLVNNFGIYVKAYLLQTLGFWAPANLGTTMIFTAIEGLHHDYLTTNQLVTASLWGKGPLQKILESYYRSARYFPSEGVWIWLMFFCCFFRSLMKRDRQSLIIFAPCLLCWISLMLAVPVYTGTRYALSFFYGIPVFLTLAIL